VRAALLEAVPDLGPIVLEACLLPKSSKPFDMWLPKHHIAMEVDGPQHFRKQMHDKTAQEQRQRDRSYDAKCRQAGLRLLRFHHADDKQWARLLQDAIKTVKENPHSSFVWHTKSYAYESARLAAPTL
jgi:hypothetical protein